MARNMLTEYVIRLGADVDNSGLQMLFQLLDSAKVRALGVSAALGLASVGVYKFIESVVKQEEELINLDKKQKANIETINAQNKALSAMGKTLQEVEKDDRLNKVYKDIVKFNKELELPNADGAMRKIEALQASFWKLRSGVKYVVQSIGRQVMINLEAPIKRITGGLNSISDWIKNNFSSITMKVSSVLTAFAKGVIGIGETIGNIFKWLGEMPSSIKAIATALGVVFGLLNSGPLGKLMALISWIGDTIHDAENYQWNQQNAKDTKFYAADNEKGWTRNKNDKNVIKDANGNAVAYQIATAYDGIWEILYSDAEDKGGQIATKIIEGLTGFFDGAWGENGGSLGSFFNGEDGNGGLFGAIKKWLDDDKNKQGLADLGTSFIKFFVRSINEVGGLFGGAIGGVFEAIMGDGVVSDEVFNDTQAGATFAGTFGGFISFAIKEMGKEGSTIQSVFKSALGGGLLGMLITAISSSITVNENGEVDWGASFEEFKGAILPVGKSIWGIICKAIEAVDDIGSLVFTALANGIKGLTGGEGIDAQLLKPLTDAFELLGKEDSIFGKAISEGLTAGIASGSGLIGLITGLTRVITEAVSDPTKFAAEFNELIGAFGQFFGIIWDIVWEGQPDPVTGQKQGGFLKKLILGDDGEGGLKKFFTDIANDITGWLSPLGDAIVRFFEGIWVKLYNNAPDWLRAAFGVAGVEDPNTSTIRQNDDGTFSLVSTNGKEKVLTPQELGALSGVHVKESNTEYGIDENTVFNLSVDENTGEIIGTNGQVFSINSPLGNGLYFENAWRMQEKNEEERARRQAEIDKSRQETEALYNRYGLHTVKPEGAGTFNENGGLIPDEVVVPMEGDLDEAGLQEQANSLNLKTEVHGSLVMDGEEGANGGGQAFGGRFGRRTRVDVAEDGAEYIIPITKPERAASLIKQMFAEMGGSAVSKIVSGLGLGEAGTNGASMSAMSSVMSGMTMANTYNINAPVNINVNSTGADAKDIGSEVYNLAERHLIKNIMGVYG